MANVVQEYDLNFADTAGPVVIQMPAQGIIGMRLDGEVPTEVLKIFVIVDPTVQVVARFFQLFSTGEPLVPYKKFLGTFKMVGKDGVENFRHAFEV